MRKLAGRRRRRTDPRGWVVPGRVVVIVLAIAALLTLFFWWVWLPWLVRDFEPPARTTEPATPGQ